MVNSTTRLHDCKRVVGLTRMAISLILEYSLALLFHPPKNKKVFPCSCIFLYIFFIFIYLFFLRMDKGWFQIHLRLSFPTHYMMLYKIIYVCVYIYIYIYYLNYSHHTRLR